MALFAIRNTMVEECIYDFKYGLSENDEGLGLSNINIDFNETFSDAIEKIKNDQNAGPEEKKLGILILKTMQPTWLEKKQLQLEAKLHKYELQAKSDQTGVFKKVWIKIKSFIVKIIHLITKALAKAQRFVKNKYYEYKLKKQVKRTAKEKGVDPNSIPFL